MYSPLLKDQLMKCDVFRQSRMLLSLAVVSVLAGCGSDQDACSVVKDEGKYSQIEQVVCDPQEPAYIKDIIASVVASHSEKHKYSDALEWSKKSLLANDNIVSQHYNAVLLLSQTDRDEQTWSAIELAAKNGVKPAVDEMIKRAGSADLSKEQNRLDLIAWSMLGALPGPIIDASIKDLDSFRVLDGYLASSVDKNRNFSIEYFEAKGSEPYIDEIKSDSSLPYLAKAKARAIELAKYQLDFDNEVGDYIDAASKKPERPKVELPAQGMSQSSANQPYAVGDHGHQSESAQSAGQSSVPIIKSKAGEVEETQYVELNGKVIYDQDDHSLSFASTFDVDGAKVILLEAHAGCANYCYSYAFLRINPDGSASHSESFSTGYPLVSSTMERGAVKAMLVTPGGRNDQEWAYENGVLKQTRFVDMSIENSADKVKIESWEAPVRVKGVLQNSSDNSGVVLHFNKKTLLTGDCDNLVDEISVSEPGNIPLNTAGYFDAAISCPTAGVFIESIKFIKPDAQEVPANETPTNSAASAESPAAKILAAARDCLKKSKFDCAKSKAEAALDIDPGNAEATTIKSKAEAAQQKAFDGDWGAE
jgi:hypothetical protein